MSRLTAAEYLLLAFSKEKDGNFREAITDYTSAIDLLLYRSMMQITDPQVQNVVRSRARCFSRMSTPPTQGERA